MRWLVGSLITGFAVCLMFIGSCLVWAAWHLAYTGEWLVE